MKINQNRCITFKALIINDAAYKAQTDNGSISYIELKPTDSHLSTYSTLMNDDGMINLSLIERSGVTSLKLNKKKPQLITINKRPSDLISSNYQKVRNLLLELSFIDDEKKILSDYVLNKPKNIENIKLRNKFIKIINDTILKMIDFTPKK